MTDSESFFALDAIQTKHHFIDFFQLNKSAKSEYPLITNVSESCMETGFIPHL